MSHFLRHLCVHLSSPIYLFAGAPPPLWRLCAAARLLVKKHATWVQCRGVSLGVCLLRQEPTWQRRWPGRPPRGGTRHACARVFPSRGNSRGLLPWTNAAHKRGCPLAAPGPPAWRPAWLAASRSTAAWAAAMGRLLRTRRGETRSLRLPLAVPFLLLLLAICCGPLHQLACLLHSNYPAARACWLAGRSGDRYCHTGRFSNHIRSARPRAFAFRQA